jgi:SAM-dependent MidA family methyltransferase
MIVEPHEENVKEQKRYFQDSFGNLVVLDHVSRVDELSLESAFVVANELFDAFKCEVIRDDKMLYIDGKEIYFDRQDEKTRKLCQKYDIKRAELAIGYEEFASKLSKAIKRFEFVTFDYGEKQKREDYSIRIYHKHHTYPFFALTHFVTDKEEKPKDITLKDLYKKSDLTYDVNFTHLVDAFKEAGVKEYLYKTQMSMLVHFGIIELLEILQKNSTKKVYESELNRIKLLIDPAFMGERFKGVVFRKS